MESGTSFSRSDRAVSEGVRRPGAYQNVVNTASGQGHSNSVNRSGARPKFGLSPVYGKHIFPKRARGARIGRIK